MADNLFGYTGTQTLARTSPIQVNARPDLRAASAMESILNLTQTGIKIYSDIAKEDKEEAIRLQHRDTQEWYQTKYNTLMTNLGNSGDNISKRQELIDGFDKEVKDFSKTVDTKVADNLYTTHFNIMPFFSRQQSTLQQKENVDNFSTDISVISKSFVLSTKEQQAATLQEYYTAGEKIGINKKEVGDMFLQNVADTLINGVDPKQLSYGTYNTIKTQIDNILELDPKLTNSKGHNEVESKLRAFKSSLDSTTNAAINAAIQVKDTKMFNRLNEEAYRNGGISQDIYTLNKKEMTAKLVDKEAIFQDNLVKVMAATGGKVNLSDIKLMSNSKTSTMLTKQVKLNIANELFADVPNIENLSWHKANNNSEFTSIFNEQYKEALLNMENNVDNPKMYDLFKAKLDRLDSLKGTLKYSSTDSVYVEANNVKAILESPEIVNKQAALQLFRDDTKKIEYPSKTSKEGKEILKNIPEDLQDDALRQYGLLKKVKMSDSTIKKTLEENYKYLEIPDNIVQISPKAQKVLDLTDKGTKYFIEAIKENNTVKLPDNKVKEFTDIIGQDSSRLKFHNGTLIVESTDGQVFPLLFTAKEFNALKEKASILQTRNEKPTTATLMAQEINGIINDDIQSSVYGLRDTGEAMTGIAGEAYNMIVGPNKALGLVGDVVGGVQGAAEASADTVKALYKQSLDNYEKTSKKINDYLNKRYNK